jgi:hypothetical protein
MTEKAHPSVNRTADPFKTAVGFAEAGGSGAGYVVDGASPTELATQDSGIDETQLNAFAESHAADSYDVTIDPGEAYVYGSWIAKDTATTVTVDASTADQTIYAGWNKDSPDDVIIGLASAFESDDGDTDMKIPLYDVDSDGSGVTNVTDRRQVGRAIDVLNHQYDSDESGVVDDSELLAGKSRVQHLVDSPNGTPPIALLEDTESIEITVPVADSETLKVYRWGNYKIADGTAPAGLDVQLLDGGDTVQVSANVVDAESTDPSNPTASYTNASGSVSIFKLRSKNSTGSNFTTDGVGSHFAYIVE